MTAPEAGSDVPSLDPETVAAYDAGADAYAARGVITAGADRVAALQARRASTAPLLDLGCGTGNDLGVLARPLVGLDPSAAMLARAAAAHPDVPLVRAAAGALPIRPGGLGGAWASKSLQHVGAPHLPLALADLHRALAVGAPVGLRMFGGEGVRVSDAGNDLPGRRFTFWPSDALVDVIVGAGFVDVELATSPMEWGDATYLDVAATRGRTLPDTVAPGMRLLVCGLNPSLHAADAGVGYAGPGNRFWPALVEAGLCGERSARDPWRLLAQEGIGMTDVVKRATPRAAELTTAEHRAGLARLERLCTLLAPEAIVLVGLGGWRAAVDRRARAGWQPRRLGPTPAYLMPSTSGLNAGTSRAELVAHLRRAAAGPPTA
ncbi:uracil-DNA glycosylase family protein [Iamia majanohamensis]|uniref:Uracil-DNA glycosylase family protein n=1 Tax=Iamia majanohamensis TaxID=467976 RepID=A0AAF0BWS1_9ACTN|nr:uracil-DNA glycosylase family protein [Iamia majanohamensis]WCO68408.1 uracil-DNA glycosylase family protein [Iamia majanohamensis]